MTDHSEQQLSQSEEQELFMICHRHNLDSQTRWRSSRLISKYRSIAGRNQIENFSLLARISILVAAKSEVVKTIKGEKNRGIGLNLSALLQDGNVEIDKFLFNLKEFIHYVNQDSIKDKKDIQGTLIISNTYSSHERKTTEEGFRWIECRKGSQR